MLVSGTRWFPFGVPVVARECARELHKLVRRQMGVGCACMVCLATGFGPSVAINFGPPFGVIG